MQSFSISVFQMMTDSAIAEDSTKVVEQWEKKSKIMEDRDDIQMKNGEGEENKIQDTLIKESYSPRVSPTSPTKQRMRQRKGSWPIFTNEVIVIRPQIFYENKDCQVDNKFMQHTELGAENTNEIVSASLLFSY